MEGSQRDAGGRSGQGGTSAGEEPVAEADRLFVNLMEQGVRVRPRSRTDPVPPAVPEAPVPEAPVPEAADPETAVPTAAERQPPAPPPVMLQIESRDAGLLEFAEALESVRAALLATNERLESLERLLVPAEPLEAGPHERSASSDGQLDDHLTSKEDVEAASGGLPVLGLIPEVNHWKDRTVALASKETKEERLAAEAFRALRTSVLFLGIDRQMRSIQVTSPLQGEGKTTVAANLAGALAQTGTRVIALSCDLRRPRLHESFGLPNDTGLTSVIHRVEPLQSVIQQVPGIPSLKLVASGPMPPNPSELLLTDRTAEIIAVLQTQCDVLLIDSPPVLPVTDAVAVSPRVKSTILVVNAGMTSRRDVQRSVEVLRQVNAPLLGTVVNGISSDHDGYGLGFGGRYEYDSDTS